MTLTNVETGAIVPVEMSLTDGQTLLSVRPAVALEEVATYGLDLAGSIRGTDGSPLKGVGSLVAFTTNLSPGLERVEVAPAEVGSTSPVPGFDRMTGFRQGSVAVQAGTGPCHLVFEVLVSDAGDASIDSAVLIDDIHFQ